MKKMRKGFTLIELTVVMGVMALLMALAVPNYMNYRNEVKALEVQQDIKNITDEALKIMLSPSYKDDFATEVTFDIIKDRLGTNGLNYTEFGSTPSPFYEITMAAAYEDPAAPTDPEKTVNTDYLGNLIEEGGIVVKSPGAIDMLGE